MSEIRTKDERTYVLQLLSVGSKPGSNIWYDATLSRLKGWKFLRDKYGFTGHSGGFVVLTPGDARECFDYLSAQGQDISFRFVQRNTTVTEVTLLEEIKP